MGAASKVHQDVLYREGGREIRGRFKHRYDGAQIIIFYYESINPIRIPSLLKAKIIFPFGLNTFSFFKHKDKHSPQCYNHYWWCYLYSEHMRFATVVQRDISKCIFDFLHDVWMDKWCWKWRRWPCLSAFFRGIFQFNYPWIMMPPPPPPPFPSPTPVKQTASSASMPKLKQSNSSAQRKGIFTWRFSFLCYLCQ